ncbi:response regulator [Marinobacter sp.]|uniref:response regulator n=1 Tax=Marinobacter sp. TaxID=50741 RepID=UPI0035635305
MAINGAAEVILRYDDEHDREYFEALFGNDFTIQSFTSDQPARDHLCLSTKPPAAIVLIPDRPDGHLQSPLLAEARDHHPGVLKILMGDAISLNLLVTLLDDQLIDRCFEQPVNADMVRSHVLTAALTRGEASPSPVPEQAGAGARPAILIVDDEPTATRYLARQLERMQNQFRVLCASSAEEALETLRNANGDVAVVMTDQRMPGMHGKELLDELRQSYPAIVRILTSAWGEVDVALDAVNEGRIFRYQKKPWNAGELLALFRKALARHRALVSARNSSLSQAEQQFAELRQQRHARLLEHLSEPVDRLAGAQVTADFLDSLATIRTLPALPSHLRASRETPLEHELVRDFGDLVRRQLDALERSPEAAPLNRSMFDLAMANASEASTRSAADQTPLSALCQSLTILLTASGLNHSHLNIEQDDTSLGVTPASALHMYSHLLAPITRLSRPLLEQQTALLLLHVTARLLGGGIDVAGGDQSLRLSLRLPAAPEPEF